VKEHSKSIIISTWLTAFATFLLGGCVGTNDAGSSTESSSSSSSASVTVAGGTKAAKIFFKTGYPAGSFDSPSSGGTVATPGSGLQAVRIFNADGSLLAANGPTDSAWPKWISSVEIGISGSNNTSAPNADCARFAAVGEDASAKCNFKGLANPSASDLTACGAGTGLFRVSEYDCAKAATATGTGGPSDGVYIRATFNRDTTYLGSGENVMAVLEYAASTLNQAPAAPTTCFSGGVFDSTASGCADQTWKIFLKSSASETVQPFFMLVPPSFAWVRTTNGTGGSGAAAKQIILPLAGNADLSVMQISRIKALSDDVTSSGNFSKICTSNGAGLTPANSALCLGMVFYSLTFYRM
jgi:hypothetical protein